MPNIPAPPQGAPVVRPSGHSPEDSPAQGSLRLRAWFGQDEASHGTMRYPVDHEGWVQVPLEVAAPLITIGGFALSQPVGAAFSSGTLRMHHDESPGCSYAGRQYPRDQNGDVLVPAEAACELSAHGFIAVPGGATPAPERVRQAPRKRSTRS
jgi:hypothetical protein